MKWLLGAQRIIEWLLSMWMVDMEWLLGMQIDLVGDNWEFK